MIEQEYRKHPSTGTESTVIEKGLAIYIKVLEKSGNEGSSDIDANGFRKFSNQKHSAIPSTADQKYGNRGCLDIDATGFQIVLLSCIVRKPKMFSNRQYGILEMSTKRLAIKKVRYQPGGFLKVRKCAGTKIEKVG